MTNVEKITNAFIHGFVTVANVITPVNVSPPVVEIADVNIK